MNEQATPVDERTALRAQQAVTRAIATGRMVRLACEECGAINTQAHHDDYSKPLEVRWLCHKHHRAWHRQNPSGIAWPAKGSILLEPDLRDLLLEDAKREERTLTNTCHYGLKQYLNGQERIVRYKVENERLAQEREAAYDERDAVLEALESMRAAVELLNVYLNPQDNSSVASLPESAPELSTNGG